MTFRGLLEAFNKPFKYKQTNKGYENRFVFYDDMGEFYEVFVLVDSDDKGIDVDFTKNGSFEMEDSNNPFRVFATVHDILKQFINDDLNKIEFASKKADASRVKVYEVFANKLAKEYNFSKVSKEKKGIQVIYKLER